MLFRSWLQNGPRLLEAMYDFTHRLFLRADPLIRRVGYERANHWLRPFEEPTKRLAFDCHMCGQCILHATGMTCPMTCPKNLRNGPCGGVRINGHCEVYPGDALRLGGGVGAVAADDGLRPDHARPAAGRPPSPRYVGVDQLLSGGIADCPPGWEKD